MRLIPLSITWCRKWQASDEGCSLRRSRENTKIYGGVSSGRGSSPLHEEIINKIGLHWGGFPHARPTMQNPDHVDRALNQSSKNLRKKLYGIYHRSFRSCKSHVDVVKEETVLIHTTALNSSQTCLV